MGTVKANLYAFADGYARFYLQSSAASRGKTSTRGVLIHAMLSGLPPHLQALTGSLLNIAAGPSSVKKHISFGIFVDAALTSINENFTSSDTRDRADFSAAFSRCFLPVLKARVDALCTYCSRPKHTAEMCNNKRKADERASAVSLDAKQKQRGAATQVVVDKTDPNTKFGAIEAWRRDMGCFNCLTNNVPKHELDKCLCACRFYIVRGECKPKSGTCALAHDKAKRAAHIKAHPAK